MTPDFRPLHLKANCKRTERTLSYVGLADKGKGSNDRERADDLPGRRRDPAGSAIDDLLLAAAPGRETARGSLPRPFPPRRADSFSYHPDGRYPTPCRKGVA